MSDTFHIIAGRQPLVRRIGLDAQAVFEHPDIKPWRTIPDRQNCTLDFADEQGRPGRWHVKRYAAVRSPGPTPAEREVAGIRLLQQAGIPTVPLVAWGVLEDRRSFVIIDHLADFGPGDKLLDAGAPFARLSDPSADLAAKLHGAGLHHRDLYLCHFFAHVPADPIAEVELRLIDCARVKRLPRFLTRARWILKDLAQFWYSTLKHPDITDAQRDTWLHRYAATAKVEDVERLRRQIVRKVAWIGRHDVRLNRAQPNRNISIPTQGPVVGERP